jgi:hypothetical protein
LTNDGWSSLDDQGKRGGKWESLSVPCITTRDLINRYGVPHFMKIDIEGADLQALETLDGENAPDYISLELSASDPILDRLIELGYSRFKFVNGLTYRPNPPILNHEWGWRIVRKWDHLTGLVPSWLRKRQDLAPGEI